MKPVTTESEARPAATEGQPRTLRNYVGGGWETVLSKLGVLALFAAGANIGAAKMFRY